MTTQDIWHYPARITDPSTTTEIAQFSPAGDFTNTTTAAVINNYSGRQQMVWFTGFATQWSVSSNFLMHAHINWMTRGLCMFPLAHILVLLKSHKTPNTSARFR